ncbi:FecR family protein [bacterium]|nr:FecR family protein [bacterium]
MIKANQQSKSILIGCLTVTALLAGTLYLSLPAQFADAADTENRHRGKITDVEGVARKLPQLANDWITAVVGSDVVSGDRVRTLSDSQAELTLKELNVVRLGPLTTIDIVKLYEETKEGRDQTAIKVERGDIWALVSDVEDKADFKVSSPVAGAAITGTKFRISVAPDSSTILKVYKGEVRITNSPENAVLIPAELPDMRPKQIAKPKQVAGPAQISFKEWYFIVTGMQEIRIDGRGNLMAAGAFSPSDKDEENAWVEWNKRKDEELGK